MITVLYECDSKNLKGILQGQNVVYGDINERGFRKSHPRLVKYATTEIRVITILWPFVSCACTIFTMQSGAVISRYNAKWYYDVIMSEMASQITSVSVVCPTVCWGAHHTHKIKISASLAFVGGNSPVTGGSPPQKKKKKNGRAMGCFCENFRKIDRVITTTHCTSIAGHILMGLT